MYSMTCFKHRNTDSESADMLSKCSKISVVFANLVIFLPMLISKKQMNVSKLQIFKISVSSSVRHAYPSLCFILSTSFSLTTLADTKIIFKIVPGDLISKSLSSVTPNFSIKFNNEIVVTTATSSFYIQRKTQNTFI